MIIRSIKGRLLLALTLFVVLSLGLSGLALEQAFRNSVETGLKEKLKANLYSLLADSNAEHDKLELPENLQNPDFNRLESGLYAIIVDQNNNQLWRSPSAITLTIPNLPPAKVGSFQLQPLKTADLQNFYHFSYGVIWEMENGEEQHYQIHLLQSAQPVSAEIQQFRNSLWRWFTAAGLILLTLQAVMMHWGLHPLRRLARELHAIEEGQQDQLNNQYPQELEHVTKNLNLLISNERRQRQRYRDTLNDLAHSLKTPLAILRGFSSPESSEQDEQITRMDDIISHQLQRASSESTTINRLSMQPVSVSTLCDRLLKTLHKVYANKPINSSNLINSELVLRIDERDLLEVFGNLLDNAFKACHSQVSVSAQSNADGEWSINIEDDGNGIAEEQRQQVLQRGCRADTRHAGQGIGLAVAGDILNSYQASLHIEQSQLGGAKFTITFPPQ